MKSALLLDVVVAERPTILELLAGEDEALLIWGDALLVLNLRLDVIDRVGRLDLQSDGLAGKGLDEYLHATPKAKNQVQGALLLDVVVAQGPTILKLLASEDKALLVGRNAFLILDLRLHVVDGIRRLHLKGDGLACEGLHENLHATAKPEDKVQSRLLLNVVVRQGPTVFELLAGEDQALLIRRDALLVLDL